MTDTVKIVGNEVGDDYSTLSSAIAAVPPDITTTSGNYIIKCRADKTYVGFSFPSCVQDSSHRLIIRAHESGMVNGKGEGAIITDASSWRGMITLKNPFDTLKGFRLISTGASSYGDIVGADGMTGHAYIEDCYLSGKTGLYVANSGSPKLTFNNTIFAECSDRNMDLGNIGGGCRLVFNKVTVIRSPANGGFDNAGWGSGKVSLKDCLSVDNTGNDYNGGGNGYLFVDYAASSDTTAGSRVKGGTGTYFNNISITSELEDPNGLAPDYNLKSTSTLNTAGSDGGRIGAFLGAVVNPSSDQDITAISTEQLTQTQSINISELNTVNAITCKQATNSQLSEVTLNNQLSAITTEQITNCSLSAIANINTLTAINAEQLSQGQALDNSASQVIYAVQAQQLSQALTVNVTSNGAQDINVVIAEQLTQAQTISTEELQQLQAIITQQITESINANVEQQLSLSAITAEQLTESVTVTVNESSGIFVSVVQTEQLTQAISASIDVAEIISTVIAQQLTQYSAQQVSIDLTVSAVIAEQLTHAELINVVLQNISNQLNIDIDQITIEMLTPTYEIEMLTPTYTIEHIH